jgi:pimeloyl-ACP methyl ester carboxylesterase
MAKRSRGAATGGGFTLSVGMPRTHLIDLDDSRSLFVREAGRGPPLVLIHGAVTTHADWAPEMIDALAARWRVLVVDRPGHGESRRPRFMGSPRLQARQIREGVSRLTKEPTVLVGHSFGGIVALMMAASHPEWVAGAVLLAPLCFPEVRPVEQGFLGPRASPFWGPLMSAAAQAAIDLAFLKAAHKLMWSPNQAPEAWDRRYPYHHVLTARNFATEGEDALAAAPAALDSYIAPQSVRAPVHFVIGSRDLVADPNRHARPFFLGAPDAALTTLPGAGHMVHHTHPEAVLAAIADVGARARRRTLQPA